MILVNIDNYSIDDYNSINLINPETLVVTFFCLPAKGV